MTYIENAYLVRADESEVKPLFVGATLTTTRKTYAVPRPGTGGPNEAPLEDNVEVVSKEINGLPVIGEVEVRAGSYFVKDFYVPGWHEGLGRWIEGTTGPETVVKQTGVRAAVIFQSKSDK